MTRPRCVYNDFVVTLALPKSTGPTRSGGFTLIELLVVISIIALLIAMLMPAIKRSRENAKTMICHSNKRGIGTALLTFANDHEGWMPHPYLNPQPEGCQGYHCEPYWSVILQHEGYGEWGIGTGKLDKQINYLCPSGKWNSSAGGATSFGMNIDYDAPEPINVFADIPIPGDRYTEARNPSDVLILVDSFQEVVGLVGVGKQVWHVSHGGEILNALAAAYHDEDFRAWFLDGHAQSLTPRELGIDHNFFLYYRWKILGRAIAR